MCRSQSVGVGKVVVDVETARVQSDTHAGNDASLQSLRVADFVLQLVSVLLILLCLAFALYVVYKRRRLLRMRRFSDFGVQTDSEIGTREDCGDCDDNDDVDNDDDDKEEGQELLAKS